MSHSRASVFNNDKSQVRVHAAILPSTYLMLIFHTSIENHFHFEGLLKHEMDLNCVPVSSGR